MGLNLTNCPAKVYLYSRDPLHLGNIPDSLPPEIITEKEQVFDIRLTDGTIDFVRLGKSFSAQAPAWTVFELEYKEASEEKLLLWAECYCGIWLNGKCIFDQLLDNKHTGPIILPLRAGKNQLAIRVTAGIDTWSLVTAPEENMLRQRYIFKNLLIPSENNRKYEAYLKMTHSSEWTDLIRHDTESNRMNDAEILVTDTDGKPLAGVDCEIRQTNSEFLFGANLFPLGQLGEERNALWEKAFLELFNFGTAPLVWRDYEPTPGHFRFDISSSPIWRKPAIDSVIRFAKEHHIKLKAQPLVAAWQPEWASHDHTQLRKEYERYFDALAERYSDSFDMIDVENEAMMPHRRWKDSPLFTPDFDFVNWAFREAEKRFSKRTILEINDATGVNTPGCAAEYQKWIRTFIERGANIRSVGIQFHLYNQCKAMLLHLEQNCAYGLADLRKTYLSYTSLNKPLFISEVTIPAVLPFGISGEEVQAEFVEQFYRLWFSIPNMHGILYWNLADGMAFGNEGDVYGSLYRSDLSPKPAALRLKKLIHEEWRTNLKCTTDENGKIHFRGFLGTFELKLNGKTQNTVSTFELGANSERTIHRIMMN